MMKNYWLNKKNDRDYWTIIRPKISSKIDTLPGASNLGGNWTITLKVESSNSKGKKWRCFECVDWMKYWN